MKSDFLLKTENAKKLYNEFARELPIIDYHNHLNVRDILFDRRYESLYDLWLAPDPYKHRLMRICGVDENFITGGADPREKFVKFCEIFPYVAGNPVYDWAKMELSLLGIDKLPSAETADYIYDFSREILSSSEYGTKGILSRFNIEYQSPVAQPLDDLSVFCGSGVFPSLRADDLLCPSDELKLRLSSRTGVKITDESSYISAVCVLLDEFSRAGCRFADHSLDAGFFEGDTDKKKEQALVRLGVEYAKRGWTLLLHLNAKRNTSDRLARLAGAAGGYAAVGSGFPISKICDILSEMEKCTKLPDTVIFPLNMSDAPSVSVLQGSFSEDGIRSKVGLGPAWWWCDHIFGIRHTLECISSFGALSCFVGMTTDSRSILSFVRHDYFRRILCSFIDEKNEENGWELPFGYQGDIVNKICYENAKLKIKD